MKRLIAVRHAKSSWDAPELEDQFRPLAPRGWKDAPRMAKALLASGMLPHVALVSPATRTRQTWACFASVLPSHVEVLEVPALYEAGASRLADVIATVPRWVESVMVIAHNPGLETFVSERAGTPVRMTTANVVVLASDVRRWEDWTGASAEVELTLRPREPRS